MRDFFNRALNKLTGFIEDKRTQTILRTFEIIAIPIALWTVWMTVQASKEATYQTSIAVQGLNNQLEFNSWDTLNLRTTANVGKQKALQYLFSVQPSISGLKQDCEYMGGVEDGVCDIRPDFSQTQLTAHDNLIGLSNSNFSGVNLSHSSLERIKIDQVDFSDATLANVSWKSVLARDVNMSKTRWVSGQFSGTVLFKVADFTNAHFTSIDLSGAKFNFVNFSDANFCAKLAVAQRGFAEKGCATGISLRNTINAWYLKGNAPLFLERAIEEPFLIFACEKKPIPVRIRDGNDFKMAINWKHWGCTQTDVRPEQN